MLVSPKKLGKYIVIRMLHPRTHARLLLGRVRQFSEALKLRARHTGALKSI